MGIIKFKAPTRAAVQRAIFFVQMQQKSIFASIPAMLSNGSFFNFYPNENLLSMKLLFTNTL